MALIAAALGLFVGSAALSWLLGHAVRRIAPRVGLVDVPGGRKAHRAPTPLGGGIAIWLTVLIGLGIGASAVGPGRDWLPGPLRIHAEGLWSRAGTLGLLVGLATLIMIMGLIDDFRGLPWKVRLAVQFGLAGVLAASGVRVTLFGPFADPIVGGLITVVWVVGLTNSFNFLDNMDGLAASVALVASLLLIGAQVAVDGLFVPAVLTLIAGALVGFLIHNRHPARMFMGDAGSNVLGFTLGSLCVLGTFTRPADGRDTPFGVLAPLLAMAVPLYDTATVVAIRLLEGRSPFQADRRHFSHRLVERGLSPPQAVGAIALVALAAGLGATLMHRLDGLAAAIPPAQALCLLGVIALLERPALAPRPRRPDPNPPIAVTTPDAEPTEPARDPR